MSGPQSGASEAKRLQLGDYRKLIRAAGKLKAVKRSGWVKKAGVVDAESIADHSFRMALLGSAIAEDGGLDAAKVTRMSLLHDLAESEIGDLMPEEKRSDALHRASEDRVVMSVLEDLPRRSRRVLLADWKELLQSNSVEAKLTWELDKLEMALQAKDYERSGCEKTKLSGFKRVYTLSSATRKIFRNYDCYP